MGKLIEIKDLSKSYKVGENETLALRKINFDVEEGDFLAVMGSSGSGKSTLMHIVGLLDNPTSGEYYFDGHDVSYLKENEQAEIRSKKIGFIFQQFNLLSRTSVLDNVLLPSVYGKIKDPEKRAAEIIRLVGLEEKTFNKSNQLSGGQIQRVAIARSLIMRPKLLLADEPTGNLDSKTARQVMEIFKKINDQGTTIILITHEEEISKYANKIIKIKDGRIESMRGNMS